VLALAAALIALVPTAALAAGSAVTEPATKVHRTTAVLNGHLDPEGDPGVTECLFEWGETVAYGNTISCAEGDAFSGPADVSATLGGLSSGETYHFRLRIETTSNGPFAGTDQSFRTRQSPSEHPLIASFGPDGTSSTSFAGAASPAMHQATRRLYVGNKGESSPSQLHGFDASTPPAFPKLVGFPFSTKSAIEFGKPIAVDNTGFASAGNVYFGTEGVTFNSKELNGISSSGATLPGFPIQTGDALSGIAVNSTGEIWVTEFFPTPGKILKYSSNGVLLGSLTFPPFPGHPDSGAHRIIFDSDDNLYVALYIGNDSSIWKFTAASNYTSATELPEPPAKAWSLAFDPSAGYLYASTFDGRVAVYDVASGELFDEFETDGGLGTAVDTTSHVVYVGGSGDGGFNKISAYATGTLLSPPTLTTAPASEIGGSKATLNGFVDPEGLTVNECKFEYGAEGESGGFGYDQAVPCSSAPGSGSGDVAVSAEVSGLTPNTTYHYRVVASNSLAEGKGLDEAFTTNPPPVIGSPTVAGLTYNTAELKALIDPKGYETTYRFEYGTTTAYGTNVPVVDANIGSGKGDVPVSAKISGLSPDTVYHWRVVAENVNGEVALPDQTFTTYGPVKVETTGSPMRTTTTALLQARVNPDGAPTTYRFEYGAEGPCDVNTCTTTPDRAGGEGGVYRFVAEQIEGLEPDTAYHYRVIAESPTPGGPAIGEDMIVTTRASDAPLTHGDFPGPIGSDRAYEQVNAPDTGGNPVPAAYAVSDNGNRAFYRVAGGTPLSPVASLLNSQYAERVETAPHQGGWRTIDIFPPREELVGSGWLEPVGAPDLSDQIFQNVDTTSGRAAIWRVRPDQPAAKVLEPALADFRGPVVVSEDGSRVLTLLWGAHDPAYTPPNNEPNLYDISSGAPKLVGLMPDGSVPSCGALIYGGGGGGAANVRRDFHWVSDDGSLVFFHICSGLYVRDLIAEETKLISPQGGFIKATPGAAFFTTSQSLAPGDTAATTSTATTSRLRRTSASPALGLVSRQTSVKLKSPKTAHAPTSALPSS
jgi:WD40 repeat protein